MEYDGVKMLAGLFITLTILVIFFLLGAGFAWCVFWASHYSRPLEQEHPGKVSLVVENLNKNS